MEPNLQEMIDAAKLRIAEKGQRQAAQEAADQQQDLNNQATVVKLAAALLPEALRDKKTEEPKYIKPVFCPLTVAVEGEQGWCLREQCAWFVTWKGQDNCAVKAIAHSQMNFTPWED